ncbi:hypothetical protein [Christiangramia marina]|uniref:hypothetical protein n=1 Tax=Christiangramia marina TaxID=409436 RepID=UPI003AA7BACD
MKNKNLYVLIPVVLIIWGVLGFKFFNSLSKDINSISTNSLQETIQNPKIPRNLRMLKLRDIDKDPFLGLSYQKPSRNYNNHHVKKISRIEWPPITYLGSIEDASDSNSIHIIKVGRSQFLFENGDIHLEVKLIRTFKNKVRLSYKGESKVFIKS